MTKLLTKNPQTGLISLEKPKQVKQGYILLNSSTNQYEEVYSMDDNNVTLSVIGTISYGDVLENYRTPVIQTAKGSYLPSKKWINNLDMDAQGKRVKFLPVRYDNGNIVAIPYSKYKAEEDKLKKIFRQYANNNPNVNIEDFEGWLAKQDMKKILGEQ